MTHPAHTPKPGLDPADLTQYVEILAQLGVDAKPVRVAVRGATQGEAPDAWLRLRGPWGQADWACEWKPRLERRGLGPIIHALKQLELERGRALLLTKHVTPPIAEELRRQGVAFVDEAGNAYIEDKGLYVWVNRRPPARRVEGTAKGLHAAGLKLLFVLLRQRAHVGTLRDFAADAGIALGGVARILRGLEQRTWIRPTRDGIELTDTAALLKRWDEGYAETLRPKLHVKTCRRKPGEPLNGLAKRIVAAGLQDELLLGGELGAALLTQNLRPAAATLHLAGIDAAEVMRRLDLVPDREGDTVLVQAFGRLNGAPKKKKGVTIADPLLLRGELLLHPDDRLQEIAETIRAEHIARRWT